MANIYKGRIDSWYGGMSDDVRIQRPEVFYISQHFDIFTKPKRLRPFPTMVADQDTTYSIVMFEYANSTLYGLGIVVGSGKVKIYYKASDPITGSWTAATSGESSAGARFEKCFKEFHGYLYGGTASRIWAYGDITGSPSFTETAYSTAGSPICNGIVTSDDKLIIPCDSGIAVKDGAGAGPTANWSTFNIIPSGYTASDIVERGDYVYIAAYPTNLIGNSKVFVWDKVSDDVSDVIDFGEGRLLILDDIDGELIGISTSGLSTTSLYGRMMARSWSGGNKARPIFELVGDDFNVLVYGNHCKFRERSKLVFGMKIVIDGTTYNQLFAVGRKNANYPLAFAFDRLVNNNTAISNSIQGLLKLGDYIFAAFNQNGSVNRTYNSTTVYTSVSPSLTTQKLNGTIEGGADVGRHRKKLTMIGLQCGALSSTNSVLTLYYRTDEESSWTKVRDYSTSNGMGFEAGIDASGAEFKNCYEFQFKLEHTQSSSAAPREPIAILYAFEDLDSDVQAD